MNSTQGVPVTQAGYPDRPRVQSATRFGNVKAMMNMTGGNYATSGLTSHTELAGPVIDGTFDRRGMLHRPTKSAANKYRQMLHGNAIQEEIDYQVSNSNIIIGGMLKNSANLVLDDQDSLARLGTQGGL